MPPDTPPHDPSSDAQPTAQRLGRVAASLQTSGGTAERKFLAIGQALEHAVAIHAALAAAFDTLLGEMHGTAVGEARGELATAATAAAALAEAPLADGTALEQMARLAEAIRGGMTALKRIVRDIDVLAMNARLTAAGMGGVGGDFLDFAGAIRRSAQLAEARLAEVNHELAALNAHLAAARTDIAAFASGHQEALRGVPARLTGAIGALATQDRLAAAATASVGRRLTEAHSKVAAMIVALQLGDITRQRIEHMVDAILILADVGPPGSSHPSPPVAAGCGLAAAQLRDTAVELDQEAERIAGRLASLAEDAREVGRVSEQTYGGADRAHSNCIAKLEQDVRDTSALFEQVWHARDETEHRVREVSDAADRLVAHVRTLGSIEADIHIMGLNTTLKCGRLGTIGRPLSIIAQALRDCGKGVMGQVGTASQQLQQLVALAASLTGAADGTADDGTPGGKTMQQPSAARGVADRMLTALGQLSHAGQALVGALDGLQRDSLAASSLLETAAAGFSVHRDLSEVLRGAADTLDGIATKPGTVDADPAATAALLDRVATSYTMARERDVHRRIAPGSAACMAAEPPPDALEDMLF